MGGKGPLASYSPRLGCLGIVKQMFGNSLVDLHNTWGARKRRTIPSCVYSTMRINSFIATIHIY